MEVMLRQPKEIQSMHEYLDSKIKFDKHQKKLIQERYKFLRKVWDIEKK